jgi:hypothetical protein
MFVRNLAAFTEALGVENAPTIVTLSTVPWPSDESRDEFIKALTGISMKEVNSNG